MRFRVTAFGSDDQPSLAQARRLREKVFCEEQGIDPSLEWDDHDDGAAHFLLWGDDAVVATARVRRCQGALKIERMAVYRERRGRGAGRALMHHVIYVLRPLAIIPPAKILLHAQTAVEEFYRRLGFEREGEIFIEADIPHVAMTAAKSGHDTVDCGATMSDLAKRVGDIVAGAKLNSAIE